MTTLIDETRACAGREIDVLRHTSNTGRYVTDDAEVIRMGEAGLLRDHGPQRLAGGMHYFTMTSKGREALNAWYAAQPKPEVRRLTRSQVRYQNFLNADNGMRFGEWLKWRAQVREERGGVDTEY